jgi:hypothetical protein
MERRDQEHGNKNKDVLLVSVGCSWFAWLLGKPSICHHAEKSTLKSPKKQNYPPPAWHSPHHLHMFSMHLMAWNAWAGNWIRGCIGCSSGASVCRACHGAMEAPDGAWKGCPGKTGGLPRGNFQHSLFSIRPIYTQPPHEAEPRASSTSHCTPGKPRLLGLEADVHTGTCEP